MKIKFLQLNMFKGLFLDKVIDFIKKEDIDIINLQEVTGSILSFKNADCFATIEKSLGYHGEMVKCWAIKDNKKAYFSNATFFKEEFALDKKEVFWLKEYQEVAYSDNLVYDTFSRAALFLCFKIEGKKIWVINTHLVRGENPKDTPLKLEHGKKLYEQVKKIKEPFILSGDFNVTPDSQIVAWFNTLGKNLIAEDKIINTLNPRVHVARHLFPQGLAVDYIFTEKSLKVIDFERVDAVDLSDHLGLYAKLQINHLHFPTKQINLG